MRVAVDVLGAPARSGGMRLFAGEFLSAWSETFPDDELVVFGYPWVAGLGLPRVRLVARPEGVVRRVVGQWLTSGVRARTARADVLISLSHVVSPLFPRGRRICTVNDWRHLANPEEFGRAQRLYRRSWVWSVAHAGVADQVSPKSLAETRAAAPSANAVLVPLGRDHAERWFSDAAPPASTRTAPYVLTFGHFVNKRPELLVDALATGRLDGQTRLVVLGAVGEHADRLRERAERHGLGDRVELPGFVPEDAYRALVSNASVLVMASSDEGFGLPVCEANWFGVPCVVTSDSGLPEIHGGRVLVAAPDAGSLAAVLATALARGPRSRTLTSGPSWRDHVTQVRGIALAT